jgi:hypothetical protein
MVELHIQAAFHSVSRAVLAYEKVRNATGDIQIEPTSMLVPDR